MAVTARVIEKSLMSALIALIGMTAHGKCATVFYCEKHLLLFSRHMVLLSELLSVLADDVSNPLGGDSNLGLHDNRLKGQHIQRTLNCLDRMLSDMQIKAGGL